jgi:RTX calcium-binding nonapeptide repeat (4 copies)
MRGVIRKSLGAAAGLLLLVPASALAGEATVQAGTVPHYQAFGSELNNLAVSELPGPNPALKTIEFRDSVPVTPGPGCTTAGAFAAHCNVPLSTGFVRIALEDENDRLAPGVLNAPATVGFAAAGGSGVDVLVGTANSDLLDGEGDNDRIVGRDGDDRLVGSTGKDAILGEAGDDTLRGGDHDDRLSGGIGVDNMFGDRGDDSVSGNDGAGGDSLDCGENLFDSDFAIFNRGDIVSPNCEQQQQV